MQTTQKKVFQLLVDNTSGVLSRISGLFSRRGYNIESITAGVTADPRITRITIVATGDDEILEQIEKQVGKLVDVRDIRELKPEKSVYRELALIKVRVSAAQRQEVIAISNIFRANIIDVGVAGGRDGGALFVKGKPPRKIQGDLAQALIDEVRAMLRAEGEGLS